MSSTTSVIGTLRDLEIIWVDLVSRLPKDMNNVTVEVYHYLDAQAPKIVAPISQPYQITEGINDTVNIASINSASGYIVDKHITLDLNVINNNLDGLGCAPNNYVVCGTATKVAIVDGRKVYSLSACELAGLINLDASGYTASVENGFLVITGDHTGEGWNLQIGNGTINSTLGLFENDEYLGNKLDLVFDLEVSPMNWISSGRYMFPSLNISDPPFKVGERYYVMFRGIEPITLRPELSQEDFTVVDKVGSPGLTYSFIM